MTDADTGPLPKLERPTPDTARRFARMLFEQGERVDMGTLATALGVGRTTLYRWVGDRDQLIGSVLAEAARDVFVVFRDEAEGEGLDRALDAIRRFMAFTSSWGPLLGFAHREPSAALRILLAQDGAVAQALREGCATAIETGTGRPADPEAVEVVVQLATALQWAPVVAGEAPAIERAVGLMRTVLEARVVTGTT